MPLYFFDTDDGDTQLRDETGLELPDDEAARDEGTRAMGEMAKDHLRGSPPQKNITMWVRNHNGETVMQLALTFAVQPIA